MKAEPPGGAASRGGVLFEFLDLCEGGVRDPLLSVEIGRFDRERERERSEG